VHEKDGEIVSVSIWDVAEFVPIGSPEHRAMVEKLRILPVPTPESKLVGRAERVTVWRYIVWALGLFWLAVGLALIWKGLAK
jgi:hypothetical protein